jgi:hypothetical protein
MDIMDIIAVDVSCACMPRYRDACLEEATKNDDAADDELIRSSDICRRRAFLDGYKPNTAAA